MPRKPSVRYFDSRAAYYVQIDGKQHRLGDGPDDSRHQGPNYLAALERYKELLSLSYVPLDRDRSSVHAVLETYMVHVSANRSPSTYRIARAALLPFAERNGNVAVGLLTATDLDRFIAEMRKPRPHGLPNHEPCRWGDCSVRTFLKNLNAALNWNVNRGNLSRNPVAGYEIPAARSRSERCLISAAEHARILAACGKGGLHDMVLALENTGARPGELIAADCADFHPEKGAIIYRGDDRRREDDFRHKTARTGRDRVIYFTGAALAVVRQRVEEHGTGPIFRGRYGKRWYQSVLNRRFRQVGERIGKPQLIPYGYRHTMATRWLESGRSVDLLAELLGNSPESIRRYYRHINPASPAVREALEGFAGG